MRTFRVHSGVASFLIASVILLRPLTAVGSARLGSDGDEGQDRRGIEVSFTKWVTIVPGYPQMEGFTGGDVTGSFSGEILVAQTTTDNGITRLEAVYEVHAGRRSFTALVQGGQNNLTGSARLDGTVLGGWRTGDRVHVKYDVIHCAEPNAFQGICFRGLIRIGPASED